jgi:predicted secreted Zn-dependent protease
MYRNPAIPSGKAVAGAEEVRVDYVNYWERKPRYAVISSRNNLLNEITLPRLPPERQS